MIQFVRRLLAAVVFLVASVSATAGPIRLTVQGLSSLSQPAALALDFIGTASNSVAVSGFQSDGGLSLSGTTGSVNGDLLSGLYFSGASFFSEALVLVGGADSVSLVFSASANAPASGGFPDAFSALLIDPVSGQPLLGSSDPTGAGSMFLFNIDGSIAGSTQLYQPSQGGVTWTLQAVDANPGALPEPASVALVGLALLSVVAVRRREALRRVAASMVALLALGTAAAHAEDLAASVEVTRGGLVLNRVTNTFDAAVTIKNTSATTLLGPLKLALASASPADVALYNSRGRLANGSDYVLVPLPTGTLNPGVSATVTVRLISARSNILGTTFAVDGQRLVPGKTATLNIQGVYAAGYQGTQELPLPGGYAVMVNGVLRGKTDSLGHLDVLVPAGPAQVMIAKPPNEGGSAIVSTTAGGTTAVKVAIDDGKEISADGVLRIDAVQQGLLSRAAPRIVARLQDGNDQSLKLGLLTDVTLQDLSGQLRNLTGIFNIQPDGSVSAAPGAFFGAIAGLSGRLTLIVGGEDANGNIYKGSASFQLSDYRVRVQLVAPPSLPGLPLANVRVTAKILNTPVQFQAQSDANGLVVLPDLPKGNLSLTAVVTAAGISYTGAGTAALGYDALVSLTLRGPQDVLANVAPIAVQPLAGNVNGASASAGSVQTHGQARAADPRRAALDQAFQRNAALARRKALAATASGTPSVAVSVAAGAEGAIVEQSAPLKVPRGTKRLTLSYTVSTAEYPTYVLQQSIYNDVWSISVFAPNGSALFEQTRQINSQLSQEPVWLPNGSTGTLKKDFDVASLTADGDATFVLKASSVNIGDSLLPTFVNATLDATEPLIITSVVATDGEVVTLNDGSYYSIPRPGAANVTQRTFTVDLSKPSGSTLTKVSVDLLNSADAQLMAVMTDAAPGAAGVEVLAQDDTTAQLKVRATIQNPASTVAGSPPPTRDLGYHLTVKANDANGVEIRDERTVGGKRSLWRMPDGLARYGARDAGGDDWVSRGGYNWLVTNAALLREIDDISGEHGANLGHAAHDRGTDIDMYHFYRFPGAVSGTQNHTLLTADVLAAFGTLQTPVPPNAPAALNRVTAWLAATRAGLQNFTNLASVSLVIHCRGVATQGLPAGWCANLIQNGTVSRTVPGTPPTTQTLNFGGEFTNAKMRWQNDHNNHVHITLNRGQIGE